MVIAMAVFFASAVCPCPARPPAKATAPAQSCCHAKKDTPDRPQPVPQSKHCPHCDGSNHASAERGAKADLDGSMAIAPAAAIAGVGSLHALGTRLIDSSDFTPCSSPPLILMICSLRN